MAEQTEWPYYWPREYDIEHLVGCICEDGWLPLPDETFINCHLCNSHD